MTDAPKRKSFTPAQRARIFSAHDGRCYLCGEKIARGTDWHVEHVIPWALTHDNSDENLRPAHPGGECHAAKTKADVKQIAKAKRQGGETGQQARRERRGSGSIPSAGFPARNRKLNGTVGPTQAAARAANEDHANDDGSVVRRSQEGKA